MYIYDISRLRVKEIFPSVNSYKCSTCGIMPGVAKLSVTLNTIGQFLISVYIIITTQ